MTPFEDPTKVRWKVKEWPQVVLQEELNNLSMLGYHVATISPKLERDRLTFVVVACLYEGESYGRG